MSNPYKPTDAGQTADALKTPPSLEDTHTQGESVIVKLGQQITAIAPSVRWSAQPVHISRVQARSTIRWWLRMDLAQL